MRSRLLELVTAAKAKPERVKCPAPGCRKSFAPKTSRQKFCSTACRVRASRTTTQSDATRRATASAGKSFADATRRELLRMKKLNSLQGRHLMFLATRMSDPAESGQSVAALSREHSRLMEELRAGQPAGDFVDEVRERRDRIAREAQAPR